VRLLQDNFGDYVINKRAIFGTLSVAFVIYTAQVYTSGTDSQHGPSISDEARYGQQVFQDKNCIACHQFYGLGGYMGPDLTNVISNYSEAYARAFIMNGTVRMPNFNLSLEETDALIAYLSFVDQTGTYPPEDYDVLWNGAVAQADDPE
jgi:nitric oxide reductase subunit C